MRLSHPALGLLTMLAVAHGETRREKLGSFKEVLSSHADLSKFQHLLEQFPEVYGALSWSQDFTLLALNNDAMDRIPGTLLKESFARGNVYEIRAVLQYHVLSGIHSTSELAPTFQYFDTWLIDSQYANVSHGQKVGIIQQSEDTSIITSGMGTRSTIIQANIEADNCLIHVIDSILIPPRSWLDTAEVFNLTGMAGWLEHTVPNLNHELARATDVTIFAPSNAALQEVGGVLAHLSRNDSYATAAYHVLQGDVAYSSTWVNGSIFTTLQGGNLDVWFGANKWFADAAQITTSDLLIDNGVVHIIDNVLSPNSTTVQPDFDLATQPPILAASSVSTVPFSAYVPSPTVTPWIKSTGSSMTITEIATNPTRTPTHGRPKGSPDEGAASPAVAAGSWFAFGIAMIAGGALIF